ncbi:MAG: OsmC family protein [Spirochaetia bacterium]
MGNKKNYTINAVSEEKFASKAMVRDHFVKTDQPETMGGSDTAPSPMELFLVSLSTCITTMAKIIAGQKQIELRGISVEVRGEYDIDAVMGKAPDTFPGFETIEVDIELDADMDLEEKRIFASEIESRCPVSNTIKKSCEILVNVAD